MKNSKKTVSLLVFNNFKNDSRVLKEAISLNNAGYNVEVIAHGDKELPKQETKRNISITRISYLDRTTAGTIAKILAYFKYIILSIKITKNSDFLHCNDLNTLPIGYITKKIFRRKVKIIYDAHEYETEQDHLTGIAKKIAKISEKALIKSADKTITVSESIANEYKKLYPFIEKPTLVLNCPNYKKIDKKDLFREKFNIHKSTTIFLFQGNLSKGRGIEIIIEAFKELNNNDVAIIFMGYGSLESYIKSVSKQSKNVFFHEAVTQENLLVHTSSADFGILFYENVCLNNYYCSPNKMFEYIMAEIPVIISNLYEMKKIITKYKVGIIAEENTPQGLKKAIIEASEIDKHKTKQNLENTKQIYNWENQEKKLIELYKSL